MLNRRLSDVASAAKYLLKAEDEIFVRGCYAVETDSETTAIILFHKI